VGQILGGMITLVGGLTGEVAGGLATTTGIGAAVGVSTIAVSTTLVVGGAANVAAGIRGLMTTGSGSGAGKEATTARVKLRQRTRAEIEANQPRDEAGKMIDPNTRRPLKSDEIDVGHKRGQEWRQRKQMHEARGSTRADVIEAENDSSLYQLEDRAANRSHRYEQK
jgi:hypothetical protein